MTHYGDSLTDKLAAQERILMDRLAELRQSYDAAAKPIVDQLVRIRSMRPPDPMAMVLPALTTAEQEAYATQWRPLVLPQIPPNQEA